MQHPGDGNGLPPNRRASHKTWKGFCAGLQAQAWNQDVPGTAAFPEAWVHLSSITRFTGSKHAGLHAIFSVPSDLGEPRGSPTPEISPDIEVRQLREACEEA